MPTTATSKWIFSRAVTVTLIRSAIVVGFFLPGNSRPADGSSRFSSAAPAVFLPLCSPVFTRVYLWQHTWVTFLEIAIGYPIGAIAGIGLGYSFGRSRLLAEIFEPIHHITASRAPRWRRFSSSG